MKFLRPIPTWKNAEASEYGYIGLWRLWVGFHITHWRCMFGSHKWEGWIETSYKDVRFCTRCDCINSRPKQ